MATMNGNKHAFNAGYSLPAPVPLRPSPRPDAFAAFAVRFSPASATDEVEHQIDDLHLRDDKVTPPRHPLTPEKDADQAGSNGQTSYYWLKVPEDEMQRVQSPPVSPVPPTWAEEMVEGGPDTTDPFPLTHLDRSRVLTPRTKKATDSEFVVVRLKERQQGQVPIIVDMYHDALSTSPIPFGINKLLLPH